jgi:multidrug efflux pump subunit AcrB
VVNTIKDRVSRLAVGPREADGKTMTVLAQGVDDPESIAGIVLGGTTENRIYLRDVATIRRSPEAPSSYRLYADKTVNANAAFLAIAKAKGSNASTVMDSALAAIEGAKRSLPKDILVVTIQNEGETARHATNELLFHLFVSIAVVVGVLIIFLGWRDALNAAFCIPLVLALVFSAAFLLGLDINRITLFALILSLGILVDDSIVMVENNARHLAAAKRTGRTPLEALTDSVREVGPSVLFSTITRIMSFIAMFAVTGMMGDYMKPIPVFATIALTASLFVAFSVNPFLAAKLHREDEHGGHEEGNGKWLRRYERVIASFSAQTPGATKRRKRLRTFFWIGLGFVMVLPVMLDVFRVRMLPKADKDQVYLWVDLRPDATVRQTRDAAKFATDILLGSGATLPQDLAIVESVSVAVGDRLPDDFANLFRGGSSRIAPNQFSVRVNLTTNDERDMTSESFVIGMRPILRSALLAKYPDARIRLLEDPPGPPTMATFEAKLKGDVDADATRLVRFSEAVQGVVREMAGSESIVDLVNSTEGARMRTVVRLDPTRLADRGLDAERVGHTLALAYVSTPIGSLPSDPWSREPRSIAVELPSKDAGDVSFLKNLTFANMRGERVALDEVAEITIEPAEPAILSEGRERTVILSAEIGPSSVVYPVLALYGRLGSDEFEKLGYRRTGMTPYGMTFEGTDGHVYRLEWGGEWKITMDTFRDLGAAMILSLLAIYFLIVGQFGSFRT